MDIRENIRIAIFSIKTNMMRSLLTMLGIIIGVASVISIITIGNGGRDYIVGMIEDMGSNAVLVSVDSTQAQDNDFITLDDVENIKEKLASERKEKAEYAKKVGQLTMQVDWLKKKSEELLGPDYESKFSKKPFEE